MKEQLHGCLIGGGIGDAIGGFYENRASASVDFLSYPWQFPTIVSFFDYLTGYYRSQGENRTFRHLFKHTASTTVFCTVLAIFTTFACFTICTT